MLDIDFIRNNPALVAEQSALKGYKVNIDELLTLDSAVRKGRGEVEEIRRRRNENAEKIKLSTGKPDPALIAEGKVMKAELATKEDALNQIESQFVQLLKKVPNMPMAHVPKGNSEEENQVVKHWGEKPKFSFTPKTHWQLAEPRGLIDKDRASKVTGTRFAYLKGGLVQLQFAIMQWVVSTLSNQSVIEKLVREHGLSIAPKAFIPVLPPAMIRTSIFDAMDRLEPRDERYRVGDEKDELWLQGSAEHTLGSMYFNETVPATELPIRYIGYSSSFRREAGSYSKDLEGIIRMHQFDKLELEVFSTSGTGFEEHKLLVAVQEHLVQQLGLHYQLLQKCTYDIGKPNVCGMDINVWMPGQDKYRETHTADYMSNYQARRLNTRYRDENGKLEFIHTNDATAFALGRIMVAIMEHYQNQDGTIRIPEVLIPWIGGLKQI